VRACRPRFADQSLGYASSMRIAVFSTHSYDRTFLDGANERYGHELVFFDPRLTNATAVLADGFPAVSAFVNDEIGGGTLRALARGGTRLVALRSAGFNNVDLETAAEVGVRVVRVPAYSPHSVAEHTIALILTLDRKIHRAYVRVRDGNFALDGLLGFDLNGRTVGVVGTGAIGATVARILSGFGCRLLGHDPFVNPDLVSLGLEYVDLPRLFAESDIITLHLPLMKETRHLVDRRAIEQMKPGVMLVNTSRGELVDSLALIDGLKSGQVGALGLDVYEEETELFYFDLSGQVIQDDVLSRFLTLPNVVITAHQGYFTVDALAQIADTTLRNVAEFEAGRRLENEICFQPDQVAPVCADGGGADDRGGRDDSAAAAA
jgi:D-lactate dehydrogenase